MAEEAATEAGGVADGGLHIVMLPWLAFGHMLPFLELANSLAQRGHRVSVLVTPGNLLRLPASPLLRLVPVPLPPVDDLPPGAESTLDIPPDLVPLLKKAADGLAGPVSSFLIAHSPDWVVSDFAFHWLPDIASSAGARSVYFSVFRAASMTFFLPPGDEVPWSSPEELTRPPPWITADCPRIAFRLHEVLSLFSPVTKINASGVSDLFRVKTTFHGCYAIAFRSSLELEPEFLALLCSIHGKPVLPIGVLPPPPRPPPSPASTALAWLDRKPPGSVVYVAFGSEARLSGEETKELALGLEQSGSPFLWAHRPSSPEEDGLPAGFEDWVLQTGLGLVSREWVAQVDVLSRRAVGGFVTHAGWSSVVEGVGAGKPLVLLPLILDQGLTARAMEEMGVGVVVPREEVTGKFTGEGVAETVRLVMGVESGARVRARVDEVKDVFASQDLNGRYVDEFARFLVDHRH